MDYSCSVCPMTKMCIKKRLEGKMKLLVMIVSMWQGGRGFLKKFCIIMNSSSSYVLNLNTFIKQVILIN